MVCSYRQIGGKERGDLKGIRVKNGDAKFLQCKQCGPIYLDNMYFQSSNYC